MLQQTRSSCYGHLSQATGAEGSRCIVACEMAIGQNSDGIPTAVNVVTTWKIKEPLYQHLYSVHISIREARRRKNLLIFGLFPKGGGGVQPKSKLFEALFFCFHLDIFQGGGGVDPNPNTFEALFCLNEDNMNIFSATFFI